MNNAEIVEELKQNLAGNIVICDCNGEDHFVQEDQGLRFHFRLDLDNNQIVVFSVEES